MAPEQFVNFRVTGWKIDAAYRRSRMEQHLNRVGRTPVRPIRVHAGAYGESQRRASLAIRHVHWRPAVDEEFHGGVLRAPSRYVQRRAVLGHIEIAVPFFVQRGDAQPEIEELPNPVSIPDARELREQLAFLCHHFGNELRFAPRNRRTPALSPRIAAA